MPELSSASVKGLGRECGSDLIGITNADPPAEAEYFAEWLAQGYAGEMGYLYGRRAAMRADVRTLLPSARSVICLGLVYNTPLPYSTRWTGPERAWISRYAWGEDYHDILKSRMRDLVSRLNAITPFE